MNILCILTVYNEIKYLPIKLAYCRANGLILYVIDNMSDDGTWEWLQENEIPSHRFDTGGAFDLPALQGEIIRTVHDLKPDWVIYNGCDLFPVVPFHSLGAFIEMIDKEGYNALDMFTITFCNTGEAREPFNPFNTYFYYEPFIHLRMIHKYHPDMSYCADHVDIPNVNPVGAGVMINYGQTKPAEEREITLKRRMKAWKNGMNPGHGQHYLEGQKRGWKWNPEELTDVRSSIYYPAVQQLQKLMP